MDAVRLDGEEEDGPAIGALGSLFKLTRVFLWSTPLSLFPSVRVSLCACVGVRVLRWVALLFTGTTAPRRRKNFRLPTKPG